MASPNKKGKGVSPKKYNSEQASPKKRGKGVSPNKSTCQSPAKRAKRPSFSWDNDLELALLDICLAFQEKHGHSHPYKWPEIILQFEERTGKTATKDILRNKLDTIKREYGQWKCLRKSESGLGYDRRTGQIRADSAWWEKKIKENKDYQKFRSKGFPPAIAEVCSQLFDDSSATGEHFVAPGMRISASQPTSNLDSPRLVEEQVDEAVADNDIELSEESGHGIERNIDTMIRHGTPNSAPASYGRQDDFSPLAAYSMQVRGSTSKARRQKRAPSKSALAADHLQGLIDRGDQISRLIESVAQGSSPSSPAAPYSMEEAMEILYRMVNNGLIDLDGNLFYFAASELRNEQTRQMFMIFKGDNERKKWLEFEFVRERSKGLM